MGKPSDKRRSAQRPGKRERARVKKLHRSEMWCSVGSAGTAYVKAGRKKFFKICDYCLKYLENMRNNGESIPKAGRVIKRLLYTITLNGNNEEK